MGMGAEGRDYKRGQGDFWVMEVFIILTVLMISQVYSYVKTYQLYTLNMCG